MSVYYKCKNCGKDHLSEIAFGDKKMFEDPTIVLQNIGFQCPKTRQFDLYNKEDMFWKD